MWSLLHRNQESVLVGTAVTLVMLALLAHGRTTIDTQSGPRVGDTIAKSKDVKPSVLPSVPSDPAYYAAKWRKIATDFYASNPVKDAQSLDGQKLEAVPPSAEVVTASLTDHADDSETVGSQDHNPIVVQPVSHSKSVSVAEPNPKSNPEPSVSESAAVKRVAVVGRPALAAAFSAGLLAFLCFRSVWPEVVSQRPSLAMSVPSNDANQTTQLRIELPSHWVHIRPPLRQRIKPVVLATSYVAGGFAAWMIVW